MKVKTILKKWEKDNSFWEFPREKMSKKNWESHVFHRGVPLISGIAHQYTFPEKKKKRSRHLLEVISVEVM